MGRSFVLRQPGGALAGYLMANRDTLKLRASGIPAEGGELTLMDARGAQSRRRLHATQQEQTLAGTDGELIGAYALGGGRVIFASDGRALEAASRALAERMRTPAKDGGRQQTREEEENARKKTDCAGCSSREPPAQETDESRERREAEALREQRRRREEMLAQRRWPPPPCLTGARYVGGRWVTATQSDTPGAPPRCGAT